MGRARLLTSLLTVLAVLWVGVTAQQEMQSRPGPGSGTMNVNVVNRAQVTATQGGEWRVVLANAPDVQVTNVVPVTIEPPQFVVVGATSRVTWTTGEVETVTVRQLARGGWIRVDTQGAGGRWINLQTARSVETR